MRAACGYGSLAKAAIVSWLRPVQSIARYAPMVVSCQHWEMQQTLESGRPSSVSCSLSLLELQIDIDHSVRTIQAGNLCGNSTVVQVRTLSGALQTMLCISNKNCIRPHVH